jgi:hypothetical protein
MSVFGRDWFLFRDLKKLSFLGGGGSLGFSVFSEKLFYGALTVQTKSKNTDI